MRIAMISTYPPIECGIATYAENLCEALKREKKETLVLSQYGASGEKVFPVFNPLDDNIAAEIFVVAAKLTPDVIHIQHEFGLYGFQQGVQINDLILRFRIAGVPVVTTLHTVKDPLPRNEKIILGNIVRECDRVIVHEAAQKKILESHFGPQKKIRVIPHGIRDMEPVAGAKAKLDIAEDQKVVLLCGYFRPTKRFDKIVRLWPRVVENHPDYVLLIAGKLRGLEYTDYQADFFEQINQSPVRDQIITLRGQFPQHTFDTIISAADVMVLPYEVGAQSGILANAAAFSLPVVTSDLESFVAWNRASGGGLTADGDDDYVRHIQSILEDDDYRRELSRKIAAYAKPFLWSQTVKDHLLIYEEVIRVPYGDARYFYVPEE